MDNWKEWNAIYSEEKKDTYQSAKAKCQALLKEMERSESKQSISKCIDYAIEHGNHLAFAWYFVHTAKLPTELFSQELQGLLSKNGMKNIPTDWLLMDELVWETEVTMSGIKENSSEPEKSTSESKDKDLGPKKKFTESKEKPFPPVIRAFDLEIDAVDYRKKNVPKPNADLKKLCIGPNNYTGWLYGTDLPQRASIIQLGFYLNLDHKQVDRLLNAAGYPVLYAKSKADVIASFYLDFYQETEGQDLLKGEQRDRGIERIRFVKEQIQTLESGQDKPEWIKETEATKQKRKGIVYYYKKPLTVKDLDLLVAESRNAGIRSNQGPDSAGTNFLTVYNNSLLQNIDPKDEKAFQEQLKHMKFGHMHYGNLRHNYEYLQFSRMKKNLYVSDWDLLNTGKENADYILQSCDEPSFSSDNIMSQFKKLKEEEMSGDGDLLRILQNLWNPVLDAWDSDPKMQKGSRSNAIYAVKGRPVDIPDLTAFQVTKISKQVVIHLYDYSILSKLQVLKYCIATGNEEKTDRYLEVAGYWQENLITKIRDKEDKDKVDIPLDKIDAMMIYAVLYRDKLINQWVSSGTDKRDADCVNRKRKIRDRFPFMKLLMEISRDIEILLLLSFPEKKSGDTYKQHMNLISRIYKKNLIFPAKYYEGTNRIPQWYMDFGETTKLWTPDM